MEKISTDEELLTLIKEIAVFLETKNVSKIDIIMSLTNILAHCAVTHPYPEHAFDSLVNMFKDAKENYLTKSSSP